MKVLIIDNYDSFTFNLYQYVGEILEDDNKTFQLDVKRNDAISLEEIRNIAYERIIISPGPGNPMDKNYFGVCSDVIEKMGPKTPILGICLGMQGIVYVYGGKIEQANIPMHGKISQIETDEKGIFKSIPSQVKAMRYHSLVVSQKELPECLSVSAWTNDTEEKVIMGIRHDVYPIEGVQFHPESFATEAGQQMLSNFIGVDFNVHEL